MKIITPFLVAIFCFFLAPQSLFAQAQSQELSFTNRIVDSIYSPTLEAYQHFWVRLPEGYQADQDTKYPVIYLLDGFSLQNTLEIVYDNYWGHYLPHMILVGISNQEHRTRNLTTSQVKMRRGAAMNTETGGAENFTLFMANELMPHIDQQYQSSTYRTLIGHSYAGLFTINTLLNHRHLFTNYIAIDPSIEWDDQQILKQANEKLSQESFAGKSLFVSLAAEQLHMWDEEITMDNIMEDESEFSLFARSIIDFSNVATATQAQNGLNFSWKVYPEDLHGTVPLPSMRDGLVFLFKWYQFKSPTKYNNPETSVDEIKALLKKQEAIYTKNFGYPFPPMIEEMMNAYGYMNMQMGSPEKAHLFFKMSTEYFPKSANGFDSLAEYYEAQNDWENALKCVKKAFELSPNDYFQERVRVLEGKR